MKKMWLLFLFVLTGCGLNTSDVFNTTCVSTNNALSLNYMEEIVMTYKDNNILSISIKHQYKANDENGTYGVASAKASLTSYSNLYQKYDYFDLNVITDDVSTYEVAFLLDVSHMDESEMDKFDITRDYIKQLRKYKEKEYECK